MMSWCLDSARRRRMLCSGRTVSVSCLEGFTFHDTRHTAATMIAKKIDVQDLDKMFGWIDPKMAMVYYNPHGSSTAARLE